NDGMDMALITFEPDMKELTYAGANNPLYLIRDNELTVIQADRKSVGYNHKGFESFKNNKLKLKKNDLLYISSDGYADQFGGEKNKKYLYSRYKSLLLSLSPYTMKEQEEMLINEFNSWKGDNEQLDDVCVIGIRV
ncbi:MAG: SpoIIE family protein phosphatase, partial [Flavobacteriales bacterium]|nr:SpoIIE family protein phosphatase [Flavobacteriales bacterium]